MEQESQSPIRNPFHRWAIGVDLGGTNIRVGLVDSSGRLTHLTKRPTPVHPGGMAIMEAIQGAIRQVLEVGKVAVSAIGMGTAGQVNWYQGRIEYCTDHLPGWGGMEVRRLLEETFGLPAWVDNDANAAMFGESWVGAAQGLKHACLLTLGTGLGGGLLSDGRILRGKRGRAAEIGHTCIVVDGELCNCGQRGCWEMYVAGKAVRRMTLAALNFGDGMSSLAAIDRTELNSRHVFEAAVAGDPAAAGVIGQLADYVAVGIVGLINLFDPEAVLIGGGMSANGEFLLEKVQKAVGRRLGNGHQGEELVRLASLGDDAGLIGAAGLALKEMALGEDRACSTGK